MGGPYNIPRNYKGEDKILFIFSRKAFAYTAVGGLIGVLFYFLFKAMKLTIVGIIFISILALIGFIIGTFKIPDSQKMSFTRKVGGEGIDEIIVRYYKFKKKKNRIYVYKEKEEEEAKDGK